MTFLKDILCVHQDIWYDRVNRESLDTEVFILSVSVLRSGSYGTFSIPLPVAQSRGELIAGPVHGCVIILFSCHVDYHFNWNVKHVVVLRCGFVCLRGFSK